MSRVRMRLATGLVMVCVLAGACGRSNARSGNNVLPCPPPGAGVASSPGCVSIDPNAGISANNAYRDYRSAPPSTAAAGQVAAELPAILRSIQAHPPITELTVSTALDAAFPYPTYEVEVSKDAARIPGGIGYGIYVQGSCVHGWVMADDQNVAIDGLSGDGGCLPLLGH